MMNGRKYFFTDDNMEEFPDWQTVELGKIAEIRRGNGLSKASLIHSGEKECILYGQLFTQYGTIIDKVLSKTNDSSSALSKHGDILMPTSDVTPDGLATACVIFKNGVLLGSDMNIIRPDDNIVDSGFLGYQINYRKSLIIKKVSGSSVKHIYPKDLLDLKYSLPSLPEQEKIAEFFGALDERIALTADRVRLLKEQKKGYLQQVFNRELVFTDDNGEQYPEWEQKKLEEVASVTSGKRLPKGHQFTSSGTPYITVSDMGDKRVDHKKFSFISPATETVLQRYKVTNGDVIISIAGTLGKVNLIDASLEQANLTENCDKIRVNERIMPEFIYYVLKSSSIQSDIEKTSTTSSQPKLALEQLRNFSIPTPSLSEQEKIAEFFGTLDERIELTENKLTLLKEQKKGYLQGIFG